MLFCAYGCFPGAEGLSLLVRTEEHVDDAGQQSDGNGGLLKMTFDDNSEYNLFTAPYTKVPKALPGVYTTTLYEEIEFPETASHKMSFIVLDPAASTNSNFSLQFDCIRFIPIEN